MPVGKSSGVSKVVKEQPVAGTADATSSGDWSGGGIGDVAYITSSIPTAANPDYIQKTTQKELIRKFLEMSPQERIGIGNRLKNAGYQVGGLTGQATRDLRNAYLKAYSDLNDEITTYGQQLDFNTYLTREAGAGGGTGAGPRKPYTQSQEINDTAAKTLIDGIVRNLTGRNATKDEVAQYTAMIRAQQKKNPLVTAYTTSGGDTTGSKTTGGFGEQEAQQFLIDKISKGDEAKANRALDAYSGLVDLFGGLR